MIVNCNDLICLDLQHCLASPFLYQRDNSIVIDADAFADLERDY
jgi:hypothetical protein